MDVHEFTALVKRFITCQAEYCEECPYSDDCDADNASRLPSPSARLASMLAEILPRLEQYAEVTPDQFLEILKGE